MKTTLRAAVALAALALATSAYAQSAATRQDARFGIGVGLTSGDGGPGTLFYVPLNVAPQLRVEPFIGWRRSDRDVQNNDFTLGAGVFFVQPVASQLQMYLGGRLASHWMSSRAANGAKDEQRDTLLGGVLGGEYLPIPRVALGAEFQLAFVSFGDNRHTAPDGAVSEGGGGSGSQTQATVFVRVYLF